MVEVVVFREAITEEEEIEEGVAQEELVAEEEAGANTATDTVDSAPSRMSDQYTQYPDQELR